VFSTLGPLDPVQEVTGEYQSELERQEEVELSKAALRVKTAELVSSSISESSKSMKQVSFSDQHESQPVSIVPERSDASEAEFASVDEQVIATYVSNILASAAVDEIAEVEQFFDQKLDQLCDE
jgi:hypothetical protein